MARLPWEDKHVGYFTFDQFLTPPFNFCAIGISPALLLSSNAPFHKMNDILRKEFKVVKENFPDSKIHQKISVNSEEFEKNLSILNCNYIIPRGGWVESCESMDEKSVPKYISRASSLFAYRVLNTWVSAQLIEGLLKGSSLAQGLNFLNRVIVIFSNILKDNCQQTKNYCYFSFLFNRFQVELNRQYTYQYTSVSEFLLMNHLPIHFLKIYLIYLIGEYEKIM